jgi:hypothetical protein
MQNRNDAPGESELNPEEQALRDKLLEDSDETHLDRSIARDGEFGGGFGQGHYTDTSWDPELNPQKERDDRAGKEPDAQSHRAVHDDDYGSAGAGKFGGTQGPGLTTGGASPTTPR